MEEMRIKSAVKIEISKMSWFINYKENKKKC